MGAACAYALAALWCGLAQANPIAGLIRDIPTAHSRIRAAVQAHTANLPYGGGPVLHSNRTHVVFWQPSGSGMAFEPGYEAVVQVFLANVAADSHDPTTVYGLTGQYSDARGPAAYDSRYGGAVQATDPLPPSRCAEPPATGPGWTVCLTDTELQRELAHVIRADRLPTGPSDVYFLVTPNGLGSCIDSSSSSCALGGSATGYCAYHSVTDSGLVPYAVIPYNAISGHCSSDNPRPNSSTADPALSSISHEHSEMVTDPSGDAWIDASGMEDGDLCVATFGAPIGGSGAGAWNQDINGGHYFLQEEWSNRTGGCQSRARPDRVSFRAAPIPRRPGWMMLRAHAVDPQGRIVSYRWFFGDGRRGAGRATAHHYPHAGLYRVVLRVTDSWGNWGFYARALAVRG
jgi:hypothetical protein